MSSSAMPPAASGHFAGRSLSDLASDLRRQRSTAVGLVQHALNAITRLDRTVNAFVTVAAAWHAGRLAERPDLFDPEALERLRSAATLPAWKYVRAMRARARLADAVNALFERHDVLALPTVPLTAPLIDQRDTRLDGEQ